MNNKPKDVKCLVEYTKTSGERTHEGLIKWIFVKIAL